MVYGSRRSLEVPQKGPEHQGNVVEFRPKLAHPVVEESPSPARAGRREADVAIARREALRLQLGGAPTDRQLSSEKLRLNEQLGILRTERTTLKKELLKSDAKRDADRASRLKDIESEIAIIEVRRTDIGYWLSLNKTEVLDDAANVEVLPVREIDILRRDRFALQEELSQIGTGVFSYFKRRSLEAKLRDIDQQTRVLLDQQQHDEAVAAK